MNSLTQLGRRPQSLTLALLTFLLVGHAAQFAAAAEPLSLLDRRGKIELRGAHIEDVVQYYKDHFNIQIRYDETALDEIGVSFSTKEEALKAHRKAMIARRDSLEERLKEIGIRTEKYAELFKEVEATPYPGIDLVVDDISLHSAIAHVLRDVNHELSYRVIDNVVELTTREVVSEYLKTQIFQVEDLVYWPTSEPTGPFAPIPQEEATPENNYDYDPLIDLLTTTLDPDSWEVAGGEGRIVEGHRTLVVTQTARRLKKIEATLAALRDVRAKAKQAPQDHQPVRVEISAGAAAARRRIETALSRSISFDFDETTLGDVVDSLSEQLEIPIRVDEESLDELGIGSDSPVVFSFTQGTAGRGLQKVLKKLDPELTFIIDEEMLFITTEEIASERLSIVAYPVLDLVGGGPSGDGDGEDNDADLYRNINFDPLIEMITTTLSPESWEEAGGAGRIIEEELGGVIVVAQTDSVHQKIRLLLAELRRVAAEQAAADAGKKKEKAEKPDDFVTVVFLLWQPHDKSTHVDEKDLVKLLKETVAADSWDEEEVSVRTLPSRLIIRQRKSIHRKIYDVLIGLQVLKPAPPTNGMGGAGGFSAGAAKAGYGGGGFGGGSQGGTNFGGGFGGLEGEFSDDAVGSAGQLPPSESDSAPDDNVGD